MKMKKILSTIMVGAMVFCMVPEVHAQEGQNEEVWESTIPAPTMSGSSVSAREASWGQGRIESSDPITGCPRACAITETYSGSAYKIWAQIDVMERYDDGSTASQEGPEATGYNVSSVKTNTLISKTEKCKFIGHHKIWSTSSSGYQSVDTSKDYGF